MRRLGTGERWWAAECVIRTVGVAVLGLCALAGWWLCRDMQAPQHQPGVADAGAAALTFLCWAIGGAFLVEGPALFKLVPTPGRHLFDPGDMN